MRRCILTTLLIFIANISFAQSFSITANRGSLFIGMDNHVQITAEDHNPSSFIVTTNNGKITKNEYSTGYILTPEKLGIAEIYLSVRTSAGSTKIGAVKFDVDLIPLPVATIGGSSGGPIPLNQIKAQLGVIASLKNEYFPFDARWKITEFTLTVERDTQEIFRHVNSTATFDKETRDVLRRLQVGDKLIIDYISAVGPPKGIKTQLKFTSFTIVE